jgi:DNA-binding CsgD family transcriptional regulator
MRSATTAASSAPDPVATSASPNPETEPPAPYGQASGLAALATFLDRSAAAPVGLLIEGDIGAGKSTLWQAGTAEARRRGFRVLVARPTEAETSLGFAALGDLLGRSLEAQWDLPAPQLRALRVATLLDDPDAAPPDQRAVSVATLTLVRALARRSPVLIAVDDIHWLDSATARALEFVLRRLVDEPVGVLMSRRTDGREQGTGLAIVDIAGSEPARVTPSPLDPDAIDALLRQHIDARLPRPVIRQVEDASGGNPLFALEIGRAIGRGEIVPNPPLRLAVPETLQQLVEGRLVDLSVDLRELLFVIAAVAEPEVDLLARFGGADPDRRLREAIALGLIVVDGTSIRFTHPLFGATIYHAIPAERRRELHRVLARLVRGSHEHARQLSLAAEGPDPAVAAALDEAALDAASRGALDAAAGLAEQAVRLTPDTDGDALRSRRLHAAEFHFAAGDSRRARAELERLVRHALPGPERADVLRRLAKVRYRTDSTSVAADLLSRALEEADGHPALRAEIERDLAWAVTLCGDVGDAERHAEAALELVRDAADEPMRAELLAAVAMARFLRGRGLDAEVMQQAVERERPASGTPIEWRPRMILGMMRKWSGDLRGAQATFDALHRETVDAGDEASLPFLLSQLSETETLAGRATRGRDLADEAATLAIQTGQEPIRAFALHARALADAQLGDMDGARHAALEGLRVAEGAGSVVAMMLNQSVLGCIDLWSDDPAAADARLGPLVAWLDVVGIREPGVIRFLPDAVEALIALGRLDEAETLLGALEADGTKLRSAWTTLSAARVGAILLAARGQTARAVRELQAAIDALGPAVPPFDRARALLVLGTIQRRTRSRRAARASLGEALEQFESIGAVGWATRARTLLGSAAAATSSPSTAEGSPARASLTPAERRVVDLVAAGATNRETADRLFVSVRAVEVHLTSVYRKLGIRSRTELAALLAGSHTSPHPTDRTE